jgi:hypothetical protein
MCHDNRILAIVTKADLNPRLMQSFLVPDARLLNLLEDRILAIEKHLGIEPPVPRIDTCVDRIPE